MVTTMKPLTSSWMSKYQNHPDLLACFTYEQDYVDAMFVQIVMYNFSVYIKTTDLLNT